MNAQLMAAVALSACASATAQVCQAPSFDTIQPEALAADAVPVRVTNLMRIGLPATIGRMAFDPQGLVVSYADGRSLLLQFDDASLARRHNGVKGKAGPLLSAMFHGSSRDGCRLLKVFRFDRRDYRVTFTRGPITVYAHSAGSKHEFTAIHANKPDVVVQGLAKDFERSAFLALISSIQPPEQE